MQLIPLKPVYLIPKINQKNGLIEFLDNYYPQTPCQIYSVLQKRDRLLS